MAQTLSADEIDQVLRTLDDWYGDPEAITRSATLPSFSDAIDVVDRVATVAESVDHHPDIDIRFNTLTFTCSTHTAGGVTAADVDLAHRIEGVLNEV